jgi:CheY-like chemotaxis protein
MNQTPQNIFDNGKSAILLVEDDDNDVMLFGRALKRNKIALPFRHVKNGEEAKEYLHGGRASNRSKLPVPGLIITDLKMPKMNGFQLLQWIKEQPDCAMIPTLILSSSRYPSDIAAAFALGVNAYFVKPGTFEELVILVKTIWEFWSRSELPPVPGSNV